MKPLIVLFSVFALSLMITRVLHQTYHIVLSERIALAVMLIFTSIAHFFFTEGMEMMLPSFIPYKTQVIYMTGVIEIIAAIGLFIRPYRELTAWLLIAFFILILPANIFAAIKQIDYQNATYDGPGLRYLWFRIPLQIVFILWTYFTAIKIDWFLK